MQIRSQPRALVESSLERVLGSAVFRRSDRHRRFLRHVVQAALDGREDTIKEVLIGVELFDRRLDRYDPRSDPIVRVEAGRIRAKLARYYLSEGAGDAFGFDIPTGAYVPVFAPRRAAKAGAAVDTYAVLRFTVQDDGDLGFSTGLADQLINLLGRVGDLRVVARSSSLAARDRPVAPQEAARLLKATRIVDGSIQRQGERLRCFARIEAVADGTLVWSQSFDSLLLSNDGRPMDPFSFQDAIAESIVSAAVPQLGRSVARARAVEPHRSEPVSMSREHAARRLLDQATYLSRRLDAANCGKIVELADEARELDPDSAAAHVLLAIAYFQQTILNVVPTSAVRPRIAFALERALVLDPADSEALALNAMIAFRFSYDWKRSEQLFREAFRVSPHASTINYRYAFCLILNRRFEQGLQHLGVAVDLDPLNLGLRASAALLLALTGDFTRAEQDARSVLNLEPHHPFMNIGLGLIHLYQAAVRRGAARASTR